MRINAVFQGGGVKAIGLVGAVSAAEARGVAFHQVAGTSSGSMVAAMLAAGYTAEEMKQIIMETSFQSFLKTTTIHQFKFIGPALRLLVRKGLYSGSKLEQWMRKKLQAKGVCTFGDLKENQLRIIASDITEGKLLVLPDDIAQYGMDPMKLEVARAVRMSTSIPYFFDPVVIRRQYQQGEPLDAMLHPYVYIVDGGLLSNFPLWLFDSRESGTNSRIPTIGFQLVGKNSGKPKRIVGPISMFKALFETMMDAHDERYIEEHNLFRTIKIPTVGVSVTQFNISEEESQRLFESGFKAGNKFLDRWSLAAYMSSYDKLLGSSSRIL